MPDSPMHSSGGKLLFNTCAPVCIKLLNVNPEKEFYVHKIFVIVGECSDKIKQELKQLATALNTKSKIPQLSAIPKLYGAAWKQVLYLDEFKDNDWVKQGGNILSNDWDEMDDDEFDQLLNEGIGSTYGNSYYNKTKRVSSKTLQLSSTGLEIEFITDIPVYEEDTIEELKNKIEYITKIPYYKQYLASDDMAVGYYLEISNGVHIDAIRPNILDIDYSIAIAGVPIHETFNKIYDNIKIIATDYSTKVGDIGIEYTLLTLDSFISDKYELQYISSADTTSYYSIYKGFIGMYFPIITETIYPMYVSNENELYSYYPSISLDRKTFKDKLAKETSMIQSINTISDNKVSHAINTKSLDLVFDGYGDTIISIKRLFDAIEIATVVDDKGRPIVNYIDMVISVKHVSTVIRKTNLITTTSPAKVSSDIQTNSIEICLFPTVNFKEINVLIDATGYVSIHGETTGTVLMDKAQFISEIETIVNKMLKTINSLDDSIFITNHKLPVLNTKGDSYSIRHASVGIMFNQQYDYDKFIKMMDDLLSTNVFKYAKNDKMNTGIIYVLAKNITSFSKTAIDYITKTSTNTFDYLSDESRLKNMMTIFDSKKIYIKYIKNYLSVEILNLDLAESQFYVSLVLRLVASKQNDLLNNKTSTDKLKLVDPVLFNYKADTLYPRLCQKKMQPKITTKDDKKGVKYINYTYNRDEYYKCTDKTYNYLGMIIGQHPEGYCLPCCRKKPVKDDLIEKCSKSDSSVKDPSWHSRTYVQYIMEYPSSSMPTSRIIDRKSYLPKYIQKILGTSGIIANGTLRSMDMYNPDSHLDAIGIYAAYYNVSISEMAIAINTFLSKGFEQFSYLLGGKISTIFNDLNGLMHAINNTFILNKPVDTGPSEHDLTSQWNSILVEIMYYYGLNTFILNDDCDDKGISLTNTEMYNPENQTIIVLTRYNQEYKDISAISTWAMIPITVEYKVSKNITASVVMTMPHEVIEACLKIHSLANQTQYIARTKQFTYSNIANVAELKKKYITDKYRLVAVQASLAKNKDIMIYPLNEKVKFDESIEADTINSAFKKDSTTASVDDFISFIQKYNMAIVNAKTVDTSLIEYIKINIDGTDMKQLWAKTLNLGTHPKYLVKVISFVISDENVIGSVVGTIDKDKIVNTYRCYFAQTSIRSVEKTIASYSKDYKGSLDHIISSGKSSARSGESVMASHLVSVLTHPINYYRFSIKHCILYKYKDRVSESFWHLFSDCVVSPYDAVPKNDDIANSSEYLSGFYMRYVYKVFAYKVVEILSDVKSDDIKQDLYEALSKLTDMELKLMSHNTSSDIISSLQTKYKDKYDNDLIELAIESTLQMVVSQSMSNKKKQKLIDAYKSALDNNTSLPINNLFVDTLMLKPAAFIEEMISKYTDKTIKLVSSIKDTGIGDVKSRDGWMSGASFCMLKEDHPKLKQILSLDLSNPLKRRYLFSGRQIEEILNNSNFTHYKNELIYINAY